MILDLFPYQAQGADLLASRERFGLHDEMGIGKTAQAIGAMDRIKGVRGAVICPAMLRENWLREFAKFARYERRICKARTIHDFIAWMRGRFDVLVLSYEQATKWAADFVAKGDYIDFLVMDEAHYLKNAGSQRSRAILGHNARGFDGWTIWALQSWHVTGTPMANDPSDAYTFLQFARATDMEAEDFNKTFFNSFQTTYSTRNTLREDMLPALRQLIYNNSLRRTHDMVGMELPPIHMTEVLVEGEMIDLEKALAEYPHVEDAIVLAIQNNDISWLSAEYVAIIRRLVGKAKAVAYADLLKLELDAGARKRVVFCWHTEPLLYVHNFLKRRGYKSCVIFGGTMERDDNAAIDAFQNDPSMAVAILNIKKGGTGLTLTAACDVDMLESDWSPAGNAQAIKRVHRYGQDREVRARFITLAKSIDISVNRIVAAKTKAIAEIEGHAMNAAPNPAAPAA